MTLPTRGLWTNYLPLVQNAATGYGVDPALVLGIITAESYFDPNAYRAEPQIGDASRGLMQLLLRTAQALGFNGSPDDLFDPAVNIALGTQLIAENIAARGDIAAAVSQYNGGYRPALGFGVPLATTGRFANQAYVDRVLGFAGEYATALQGDQGTGPGPTDPGDATGGIGIALGILAAAIGLWWSGR